MESLSPNSRFDLRPALPMGVALLLMGALSDHLALGRPTAVRALALIGLVLLTAVRHRDFDWRRAFRPASWLLAVAAIFTYRVPGQPAGAVFAALLVGLTCHLLRAEPRRPISRVPVIGAALHTLGWTLHLTWPVTFPPIERACRAWSSAIGEWVLGHELLLGPTPLGLWVAISASAFLLARFGLVERRPWMLLAGHAGLLATSVAHLCLVEAIDLGARGSGAMEWAPALFALLCIPWVAVLVARPLAQTFESTDSNRNKLAWGAASASIGVLALSLLTALRLPADHGRIVFYSENEGPILDWKKPTVDVHGPFSAGMFGLLPDYLRADGFDAAVSRERTLETELDGTDLLVTINVDTDWTDDELERVWSFVERGGNLLVLGDHTDVGGTMISQNRLLAPFGIRFRYDAAVPSHRNGWALDPLPRHPLFAGLADPSALGFGVGASLAIDPELAEPLVISRFALSDLGDASAADRAFLGDYEYQRGELLGDLVLVAEARYGSGRVVVFGDTSGFQNASALDTYFTFTRRLFTWLTARPLIDSRGLEKSLAILWAGLCLVAVVSWRGSVVAAPLLCAGVLAVNSAGDFVHGRLLERSPISLPVAWIDLSHGPRLDLGSEGKRGIAGLITNLQRNGYCVRLLDEFDSERIAQGEVVVVIAPVSEYCADEVSVLRDFVAAGGLLVAAAGHPHDGGLAPLLAAFGLEVGDQPVGPIPLSRPPGRPRLGVEYVEAWPVLGAAEQMADPTGPVQLYGGYRDVPLAVVVRLGSGGFFFVGDSYFFGAENLEGLQEHSPPNIDLLRRLISDARSWRSS